MIPREGRIDTHVRVLFICNQSPAVHILDSLMACKANRTVFFLSDEVFSPCRGKDNQNRIENKINYVYFVHVKDLSISTIQPLWQVLVVTTMSFV